MEAQQYVEKSQSAVQSSRGFYFFGLAVFIVMSVVLSAWAFLVLAFA